jgi:hypothetical protein
VLVAVVVAAFVATAEMAIVRPLRSRRTRIDVAERACGRAIIVDWSANRRVDRTYRPSCYGVALACSRSASTP